MRKPWIHWAAAGGMLIALLAPQAFAKGKSPSPKDALKTAIKALAKQKTFAMDVSISGGLAKDAKQLTCATPLVTRSYSTAIQRPLMKVSAPESYVFMGRPKGATLFQGQWRSLMAGPKAREIPKLVKTPEAILAVALKYAKKTGVWLDEGAETDTWSKRNKAEDRGEKSRTTARSTESETEEASGETRRPTRLRVIGPASVAIKITTEVQNSGCLDGG